MVIIIAVIATVAIIVKVRGVVGVTIADRDRETALSPPHPPHQYKHHI